MKKKPKGWYKDLVIRPTIAIEGYESYEKICSHVADFYYAAEEKELYSALINNLKDSRYVSAYTLFQVGKAKCPAYWVGEDLLTALIQSELSVDIENLQWAMKTGIFMLPKELIKSPEDYGVQAIYWHCDIEKDMLYWVAIDGVSSFCRRFKLSENLKNYIYTDSDNLNPQAVTDFNERLQSIFLRLILIMECRPEYVETESVRAKVNKGFGKDTKDYYEPLWIGRSYRYKRENSPGDRVSTGSTKSIHWRKGFIRNQPYGKGREQRKLVWIEPVMVMGKD